MWLTHRAASGFRGAIGDALGNTTEGDLPSVRSAPYGEIRDVVPNRYADGRRVRLPSDDTQLAFWTV
jgi:ADP-ribosylglycohydrolase